MTEPTVPTLPKATNWTWTLVRGMIAIPVGLTKLFDERSKVPGKSLCPKHEQPLKQSDIRHCPGNDEDEAHELLKGAALSGYEWEKGKYVVMDEQEKLALPAQHDGIIELRACVPYSDVDVDTFEGAYLAFPDAKQGTVAAKNYAITMHYLLNNNRALVGVGTWYGSTRAFVIGAKFPGFLILHVCNYLENLRVKAIEQVVAYPLPEVSEVELAMADLGFSTLPDEMDWESVTDTFVARQREVIAEKVALGRVTPPEATEEEVEVPDLLEALRAEMASHEAARTAA